MSVPIRDYLTVLGEGTQFVDVREPQEVESGSLPGSVNIPLGDLGERYSELDASRRVVLVCRSGRRSNEAAEFLTSVGFDDVVNLEGGMLALEEAS